MKEKHSSQMQAVKKKLMAATSMLLVAAIMLVSSTYAWFTLSTAPEVTGITTTVGANGSLEIALANTETWADSSMITSAVGDSRDTEGKTAETANITWGNLVDLSSANYGLSTISMLPSKLNLTDDGALSNSPLGFPTYGSDGRVIDVDGQTFTGVYDTTENGFVSTDTTQYGVRAVGTSSAISARELAYRAAKEAYKNAYTSAKNTASKTFVTNGNALAGIIVNQPIKLMAIYKQVIQETV